MLYLSADCVCVCVLLSSPPSQCRKASGARGSPPSNKVWPGSTSVRQPPSRTRFGARSACWDITRPRRRGLSLFPAASGGLRGVEACCARQNLWLQPDIRDCPPRPASSTRFRSLGSSAWFSVSLQEPTSGLCALSAADALGAAAGASSQRHHRRWLHPHPRSTTAPRL